MNAEVTSRELVLRSLRGEAVPGAACGPLAVHYCAGLAGVSLRQYTTDPRVLADCVVRYYEEFQPDAVWLSADTWITAEAMGAKVGFVDDNQPMGGIGGPCVQTPADIDRIPPPDPSSQGRQPLMLEALRRIRETLGDEVCIVTCFDQYPFSLACALMGVDQVMLKLFDDRSMIEALMERGLEYAAAYGRAFAQGGADLLSGGDSPAGLIGPQLYREVAMPLERRLVAELQSTARMPVTLHICGDATPILAEMAHTGADVLELDYRVDIGEACRILGEDVAIWGNLDPVSVLAQGDADEVRQAARDVLEAVATCGHRRFVLSSGCTLAQETPKENLRAMFEVAHDWPTS